MTDKKLSGIYGILPADLETGDLLSRAEAALKGGVRILQFRDKKQGYKRALQRAQALRQQIIRFQIRRKNSVNASKFSHLTT